MHTYIHTYIHIYITKCTFIAKYLYSFTYLDIDIYTHFYK